MSDCCLFIVEVLGNPYIKTDRIDTHAVGILYSQRSVREGKALFAH